VVNLEKAAFLIKTDGLFSYLYDDIVEEMGGNDLSAEEIQTALDDSAGAQQFLDRYRQINRESEISNIQLKELVVGISDSPDCIWLKETINTNGNRLRALEKYGATAKDSAYSIWIGSLAVFLIFMIHNYFGLFTNVYHSYPSVIFGSYLLVIVWAFRFYRKTMRNHEIKHLHYKEIYSKTREYLQRGLTSGCFSEEDLFE